MRPLKVIKNIGIEILGIVWEMVFAVSILAIFFFYSWIFSFFK